MIEESQGCGQAEPYAVAPRAKRHRAGPAPAYERLARRLETDAATGCINWTGPVTRQGYGRIGLGGRDGGHTQAHRLAYETAKGPIPEGLVIDHLCRNRRCCNPDHLEAVTSRENTRRGSSSAGREWLRSHCDSGHELTPENTRLERNGQRRCRTCARDYQRARRARTQP